MSSFSKQPKDHVLRKVREIPSLPEVVDKVVMLLSKPNTPAAEVARLISYDPGLTSKVLRMVNSAAYGFQRQISSIQHAIMILGFNTVRGLVLSSSIFKLLGKDAIDQASERADERAMWEHCVMTAMISRLLAQYFRIPETDDAFSAGLLHDVGKIVLDVYFPKDYRFVLERVRKYKLPPHGQAYLAIEQELLGMTHAEIGGLLANKWRLPVSISQVIEFHHQPEAATLCPPLVHLVALANEISHFIEQGHLLEADPTLLAALDITEWNEETVFAQFNPELMTYFNVQPGEFFRLIEGIQVEILDSQALLQDFSAA